MYVIINGVSSDTIQGLQVLSLPPITKPKMRRQVDTIDGRAGDIITELGYEAYDRTITVLLHHNYDLDAITAFFNTSGEIIFSNEPDKKYYFRLLEKIDYERAVQFKTANITFHVQPYKYPINETPLTVSSVEWEGTDYDQTPYIFRAVSDSSVEAGNREVIEQITGGTVAWNQLVTNGDFSNGTNGWSRGSSKSPISASNGEVAVTIGDAWNNDVKQAIKTQENHVYFLRYSAKCDEPLSGNNDILLATTPTSSLVPSSPMTLTESYQTSETIRKSNSSQTGIRLTLKKDGTAYIGQKYYAKSINIIDLTQMFGSTIADYIYSLEQSTAGAGVSLFKSLFPKDYYSYNAGELMSVKTSAHKTYDVDDNALGTYPLSNIELRGVPKLVSNKIQYDGDIYKADGVVTRRYGIRAYQSGDATGETMITDGTNTVYALSTPTTETTTHYTETQICSPYGTEEFIDSRDVQIPVGHKTRYKQINDQAEITVPNAGNVPSAPTIQLTGSGTVAVYLGNAQALQVNIPEDGITIDTEAQDATSNGQLANRSVTGDYDSVRLQPGDNDVSFSGDVSAVITKYTRWV